MLNKSLQNLGMDYVDLYIYHMWDWNTPVYDILDGLNRMVKAGKARFIGISNCYAWQLAKANALAEGEGFAQFVSVQGHYNLIFRKEEREMAMLCAEDNIAMTPYSALAKGIVMEAYSPVAHGEAMKNPAIAETAKKYGVSVPQLCIRYDIQLGMIVLPKTANPAHMLTNIENMTQSDLQNLLGSGDVTVTLSIK
jgi:aryl-alcohol dehydrogenase-like predicted oxidoreductase